MTCRPDKRVGFGVLALLALCTPLAAEPGDDAVAEAIAAIDRGDGVAAEIAGKRALEQGATRSQVAAYIGEGELLQGDLRDARQWLESGDFDAPTRDRGLHALARLEIADGNRDAALAVFERLLATSAGNALVWVDLAKLRYSLGDHQAAFEAAREAARLDPHEPRALEYLALMVRDSQGLAAALPLLRDGLEIAPDDGDLLEQYAATLGDMGRHQQMLAVARHLLEVSPGRTRAFLLQAILAARVGDDDLARRLMWRTEGDFDETAVGLIVAGILEYRSGNFALAVEDFDALRRMQPLNELAVLLQARAHLANGEANETVALLETRAQRPDASNYVLTLIARACEQMGDRKRAASYLDRAARLVATPPQPIPGFLPRDGSGRVIGNGLPVVELREMLSEGRLAEAQALAGGLADRFPGSADVLLVRGDVQLLTGASESALVQYRQAASIRRNFPLVLRMVAAMSASGNDAGARRVLASYLATNPRDASAAALLGRMQAASGNPARATALLRHAASIGGGAGDPLLLSDLASLELALGNGERAQRLAEDANRLQRNNRAVARTLARVWRMRGDGGGIEEALLAKSRGQGVTELASR